MISEKTCPECGKRFTSKKSSTVFCSANCATKARQETFIRLGLRAYCGKAPAVPGHKECESCVKRRSEQSRLRYAANSAKLLLCRIPDCSRLDDGRCCACCPKLSCKERCKNSPERCGMTEDKYGIM